MNDIFIRVYTDFFRSGLAAELGPQRAITLLAVAFYMDQDGKCCPSQEALAEDLGLTREQAGRRIRSLLDFRWNEQPIIQRQKVRVEGTKRYQYYSVYTILPNSQIAKFNGKVCRNNGPDIKDRSNGNRTIHPCTINNNPYNKDFNINRSIIDGTSKYRPKSETKRDLAEFPIKNSSDVVKYFAGRYQDKYEVPYVVNWKREASMIKKKLWGTYTPEQLRAIIDVIFAEYDKLWASRDFPRPSIGQLVSWLANKAMALVQEQEKKDADLERRMEGAKLDEEARKKLERWLR